MKIKRYDVTLVCAVLLLPPVLLSVGELFLSLLAFVAAVLLIIFTPIFKNFMEKTTSAIWFLAITLSTGMLSAGFGQYDADMSWLFVVWSFAFIIYFGIMVITVGIIDSEKSSN